MSLSTDACEPIRLARGMEGGDFRLPWPSFADFFLSRVRAPRLRDRVFLTYYDDDRSVVRRYTYADFGDRVARMAAFLHDALGLRRGDRVATVLFNHDQTVLLYFAAWTMGAAVVPVNVEEPAEKKRYILEHSEARAVFCWPDRREEVAGLLSQVPNPGAMVTMQDEGPAHPAWPRAASASRDTEGRGGTGPRALNLDEEALIVYTSGTTGPPKGVILTAENLLIDADGIADCHGLGQEDRLMCVLPIHHVNGTVVTLVTPFYCQGGVVLNRRFKTGLFWRRLHEEGITAASVVPTLLEFLLEAGEDLAPYRLDRFRGFLCGAGPLLKDTATRFEDRFRLPIRHGYGLSETTCYSCFLPNDLTPDERRHWLVDYEFPSIGVPIKHNVMAILDPSGKEAPAGTRGEICIRGRTVCAGYFKRKDANEAAFRWGWFRSGDEGFCVRDRRGRPFFFITGRIKELIIRGGVNIAPLEIDDVLKGHPAVQFAMAVPFENRFYGEEIAAYVVLREGHTAGEADLLAHCRSRLPFAKRPKVILFGKDVPYTATGKPKRLELKARLAEPLARYRDVQFREQQ